MRLCIKLYFLVFLASLPILVWSQVVLQGRVVNGENDQPIAGASVFLNNTNIGSSADEFGKFSFPIKRPGNYEVVVSSVGFEALVFMLQVNSNKLAKRLIKMKPASNMLEEVIVEADPGAGWRKWGKVFEEAFIGVGRNAGFCEILNKEDIYFEYDKERKLLSASARKPIRIENQALGYTIEYLLHDFHIDYRHNTQYYAGYPHFVKIENGKRFDRRRAEAYRNSLMHFIRSLYKGNFMEEGFEMRQIITEPNREKLRVKLIYKAGKDHPDSLSYYRKVMKQKDTLSYLSPQLLTTDSVVSTDGEGNKWFKSEHDLRIVSTKDKEDPLFISQQLRSHRHTKRPVSVLHFKSGRGVVIDANGTYYSPSDLLISVYWGWTSRVENLVPLDYDSSEQ